MKNKTKIVAFRPDEDVENMLKRAQENGITPTEVLNSAVRDYEHSVIKGLAKRRIHQFERLATASFNRPDRQDGGLKLAA
jgi:hypothetical protein